MSRYHKGELSSQVEELEEDFEALVKRNEELEAIIECFNDEAVLNSLQVAGEKIARELNEPDAYRWRWSNNRSLEILAEFYEELRKECRQIQLANIS